MKRYRIMNRVTGEWWNGEAPSYRLACEKAGWPVADCWIRVHTPVVADPTAESGHSYEGWKNVS